MPRTPRELDYVLYEEFNIALLTGARISGEQNLDDTPVIYVEQAGVPIAEAKTLNFLTGTITDAGDGVINIDSGSSTTATYVREKFTSVGVSFTIAGTVSFGLEIYKNGVLLVPTDDYSIAGNSITPTTAAVSTDVYTAIFWNGTSTSVYTREEDTGFTGTTFSLGSSTQTNYQLFKNGVLLTATDDYTVSGATVTLVSAAVVTDRFSSIYYTP
jgi:hypothetical protein